MTMSNMVWYLPGSWREAWKGELGSATRASPYFYGTYFIPGEGTYVFVSCWIKKPDGRIVEEKKETNRGYDRALIRSVKPRHIKASFRAGLKEQIRSKYPKPA